VIHMGLGQGVLATVVRGGDVGGGRRNPAACAGGYCGLSSEFFFRFACVVAEVDVPVYLFTYHAYRSWMPDRERGFVQKGRGVQPANEALASSYRDAAAHDAFEFDGETQCPLIWKTLAVCRDEEWRLHGASSEPTHLHAIVSWGDEALRFTRVRGRIKNLMSLDLSRRSGITGRPWFADDSSRKRVKDSRHLEYLMAEYLPRHGGVQWFDGRGWGKLPAGVDPGAWDGGSS
jgi:hypothetical protein